MATLVLSVVGTAIGGPFGQALGALVGNQIDRAVFGSGGTREGPRLKELSVTTSSYGQPIGRHFGRMRVAGTVIWATDIQESSDSEGGGKGQPSTTTYSYSASFAVALSSTPLGRVGRIWADGNLLRGSSDDLKVQGNLRIYLGNGDDPIDPLVAADQGDLAPAFRDCAYVVFEDLALADYGNRIPALTFEIFAENDSTVSLAQILPQATEVSSAPALAHARGFTDEGGPVGASLAAIDAVIPIVCATTANGLSIATVDTSSQPVRELPEHLAQADETAGEDRQRLQAGNREAAPLALRYYDETRDYQPGVQRALGMRPNGRETMVDLPAAMIADGARQLANENAQRAKWRTEKITWRMGVLDPSIQPGSIVSVPDHPGRWSVKSWEWYERGIEVALDRLPPTEIGSVATDPGSLIGPSDQPVTPTSLLYFEAPPESGSNPSQVLTFAAAGSQSPAWRGAALYVEQATGLVPIGSTETRRSVIGALTAPLEASNATLFEPNSELTVELVGDEQSFEPTDATGLAQGANRVLVGAEVIQFRDCEPNGERRWRLSGLLRGRGGTEDHATYGHAVGTPVVSLSRHLTPLDPIQIGSLPASRIAAIGRGDSEPAFADLNNLGLSRRPPAPVHPRLETNAADKWRICWTRRARGHWAWLDTVDAPLVEEAEQYLVGLGPVEAPLASWSVDTGEFVLTSSEREDLFAQFGAAQLWVSQVGTYERSAALHLATIT